MDLYQFETNLIHRVTSRTPKGIICLKKESKQTNFKTVERGKILADKISIIIKPSVRTRFDEVHT